MKILKEKERNKMGSILKTINATIDKAVSEKEFEQLLNTAIDNISKLEYERDSLKTEMITVVNEIINKRTELLVKRITHEQFNLFIDNNMPIWDSISEGQIIQVNKNTVVKEHKISTEIFGYPFYVAYLGKQKRQDAFIFNFLDGNMNRVYSHYYPDKNSE